MKSHASCCTKGSLFNFHTSCGRIVIKLHFALHQVLQHEEKWTVEFLSSGNVNLANIRVTASRAQSEWNTMRMVFVLSVGLYLKPLMECGIWLHIGRYVLFIGLHFWKIRALPRIAYVEAMCTASECIFGRYVHCIAAHVWKYVHGIGVHIWKICALHRSAYLEDSALHRSAHLEVRALHWNAYLEDTCTASDCMFGRYVECIGVHIWKFAHSFGVHIWNLRPLHRCVHLEVRPLHRSAHLEDTRSALECTFGGYTRSASDCAFGRYANCIALHIWKIRALHWFEHLPWFNCCRFWAFLRCEVTRNMFDAFICHVLCVQLVSVIRVTREEINEHYDFTYSCHPMCVASHLPQVTRFAEHRSKLMSRDRCGCTMTLLERPLPSQDPKYK
jgi:hypothetical protein